MLPTRPPRRADPGAGEGGEDWAAAAGTLSPLRARDCETRAATGFSGGTALDSSQSAEHLALRGANQRYVALICPQVADFAGTASEPKTSMRLLPVSAT